MNSTADTLGQNFGALEEGYRKVSAASKGTSLQGQGARDVFLAISEAGQTLGLSNDALAGSLRAISQIIGTGVVQFDELRSELGNHLPVAMRAAELATGKTGLELRKAIEAGSV